MKSSNGRGPSPLQPVQPDDDPMSFCSKHHVKYNPYNHGGKCPECKKESASNDVEVVDPSDYVDDERL